MALRKIIEIEGEGYVNTPNGQVAIGRQKVSVNAYCKVTEIKATKTQGKVTVQCAGDNSAVEKSYFVPFSVEDGAPNFVKQAYLELKKLPEWADASDC